MFRITDVVPEKLGMQEHVWCGRIRLKENALRLVEISQLMGGPASTEVNTAASMSVSSF